MSDGYSNSRPTYIAIVGSRNVGDRDFLKFYFLVKDHFLQVVENEKISLENVHIISGGAKGIDTIAQSIAKEFGLPITIYYPNYNKYGREAPLRRNDVIVEVSDIVIAFPRNDSRGTWYTIRKAKKKGKKVYSVNLDYIE